uniref:SJCHGC07876 protein n=1 Tax=Schistosoma japonicum TaxID=6182 RepID=Q5BRL0_SCHJA|nr:SJCHGC07876 protein [Schistosoma japonicum]
MFLRQIRVDEFPTFVTFKCVCQFTCTREYTCIRTTERKISLRISEHMPHKFSLKGRFTLTSLVTPYLNDSGQIFDGSTYPK